MIYQIDERLAKFTANVWKPTPVDIDTQITTPAVTADGSLLHGSTPLDGPQTEVERFESINWHSARPSRWLKQDAFSCLVVVTQEGKLVGDTGFIYNAETSCERQLQGVNNASR